MKSISPGTITIGVIAIVLGLVAAYAVRRSLEPEAAPVVEVKKDEGVPMVVARVNIAKNIRITAAQLEVKRVPADKLPEGSIQNPNLIVDRVAAQAIEAGERIVEDYVLGVGEKPSITHKLLPGTRALPILIPAANMSATMLHVGDVVDVHLTFEDKRPEIGGTATKTILRAVKIIAKGQPVGKAGGRNESTSANHITLMVTEEQSNKLITAQKAGTLSVTLCGDQESVNTVGGPTDENLITTAGILNLPSAAPVYSIQVWKGNKSQQLVFGQDAVREAREATAADEIRRGNREIPVDSDDPVVDAGANNPDALAGQK